MGLKAAGQPNRRGFQKPCEMPMKTSAHTRSPDRAISSALLERLRAARRASGYMGANFGGSGQFVTSRASVLPHSEPNLSLHTPAHGNTRVMAKSNLRHRISPTRTLAHVRSFEQPGTPPNVMGIERSSRNPTHGSHESTRQHTVFQKMRFENAPHVSDS